jgi:hypothetical protein
MKRKPAPLKTKGAAPANRFVEADDELAKAAELAQAIVLRYECSERPKKPRVLVCTKNR